MCGASATSLPGGAARSPMGASAPPLRTRSSKAVCVCPVHASTAAASHSLPLHRHCLSACVGAGASAQVLHPGDQPAARKQDRLARHAPCGRGAPRDGHQDAAQPRLGVQGASVRVGEAKSGGYSRRHAAPQPIVRTERRFSPLVIPKALQAALPFASKVTHAASVFLCAATWH
jgi:hypothetical protein